MKDLLFFPIEGFSNNFTEKIGIIWVDLRMNSDDNEENGLLLLRFLEVLFPVGHLHQLSDIRTSKNQQKSLTLKNIEAATLPFQGTIILLGKCNKSNLKKKIDMLPTSEDNATSQTNKLIKEENERMLLVERIYRQMDGKYSAKIIDEPYQKYCELVKTLTTGSPIPICFFSNPGFGKTCTINMILTNAQSSELPLCSSDKLGSGETMFLTQIKYADEFSVEKHYCTPEEYHERIMKLNRKALSDAVEDMAADEDDDEEKDCSTEDENEETLSLFVKKRSNSKSKYLENERIVCLLENLKTTGRLVEKVSVNDWQGVSEYFKEQLAQYDVNMENEILKVKKYVLSCPCEMLKENVELWDVPGLGEQEMGDIHSLIIGEALSNCVIIFSALDGDRSVVAKDCFPNLWKYGAFESNKQNPASIVLTSRCPKDNPHKYLDLLQNSSTYVPIFKKNISEFLDVDLDIKDKTTKKSKEKKKEQTVDFYAKYDFAKSVCDRATSLTIPHKTDAQNWTQCLDDIRKIISVRRNIEAKYTVLSGSRYALQIITLYKNKNPLKIQKDYLSLVQNLNTFVESEFLEAIKDVQYRVEETKHDLEETRTNIQNYLDNSRHLLKNRTDREVNYIIDKEVIRHLDATLQTALESIFISIERCKKTLLEGLEVETGKAIKKHKKDINKKINVLQEFKQQLIDHIESNFETLLGCRSVRTDESRENLINSMKVLSDLEDMCNDETWFDLNVVDESSKTEMEFWKECDDKRKEYKKINKKKQEELNREITLSSAYLTPMLKSSDGTLQTPTKEFQSLKDLKQAKCVSSNDSFSKKFPKFKLQRCKSNIQIQRTTIEHQDEVGVILSIDCENEIVEAIIDNKLKESLSEFTTILPCEILIGTQGGDKSHHKQRIAPIFINCIEENYGNKSYYPNYLENFVHKICIKEGVPHIIFIVVEEKYMAQAKEFLSEKLELTNGNKNNYKFVSIKSADLGFGRKRKLIMLLAEYLQLEVYHVMEDNIVYMEEYVKPIFYRHENAFVRYLIFAEAVMHHELFSSMSINEKEKTIEALIKKFLREPLRASDFLPNSKVENDWFDMISSIDKRRDFYIDPKKLLMLLQNMNNHVTPMATDTLQMYITQFETAFTKSKHIGHLSLWNSETAQGRYLTNYLDSTQKTTHFISATRGNIDTFYTPAVKHIHPVTDKVLFSKPNPKSKLEKPAKASGDLKKNAMKEGYNFADEYMIRQMLLNGVGGYQIFAFKYAAGLETRKRLTNALASPIVNADSSRKRKSTKTKSTPEKNEPTSKKKK